MGFSDIFKSKKRRAYEAAMKESQEFLDGRKPVPDRNKDQGEERIRAASPVPAGWASMIEKTGRYLKTHDVMRTMEGRPIGIQKAYDWTSNEVGMDEQDASLDECIVALERLDGGSEDWAAARKVASAYLHLLTTDIEKEMKHGEECYKLTDIVGNAISVKRKAERAKAFHDKALCASAMPPFDDVVLRRHTKAITEAGRIFENSRSRVTGALSHEVRLTRDSLFPLLERSQSHELKTRVELVEIMIKRIRGICQTYELQEPSEVRGFEEGLERFRR